MTRLESLTRKSVFKESELGRPGGEASNSLGKIPHLEIGVVVLKQEGVNLNSCSEELVVRLGRSSGQGCGGRSEYVISGTGWWTHLEKSEDKLS